MTIQAKLLCAIAVTGVAALVASAWIDLKERIIPNELAGLAAASGLGMSLILRPDETWISMLVAVMALPGLGIMAHYGMIGGGFWWTVLFDALAIASLVIGVNLVADGVYGALND